MKIYFKTIRSIFLVFFIPILILITLIHTTAIQEKSLKYLESYILKHHNITLKIDSFQSHLPLKFKASFIDIKLDDQTQVQLKNIEASIDALSLFIFKPKISSLQIEDVFIKPGISKNTNKSLDLNQVMQDIIFALSQKYIGSAKISQIQIDGISCPFDILYAPILGGYQLFVNQKKGVGQFSLIIKPSDSKIDCQFEYNEKDACSGIKEYLSFFNAQLSELEKLSGHIICDLKNKNFILYGDLKSQFKKGYFDTRFNLNNFKELDIIISNCSCFELPYIGLLKSIDVKIKKSTECALRIDEFSINGEKDRFHLSGDFNKHTSLSDLNSFDGDGSFSIDFGGEKISSLIDSETFNIFTCVKVNKGLFEINNDSMLTNLKSRFYKTLLSEKASISFSKNEKGFLGKIVALKGNTITTKSNQDFTKNKIEITKNIKLALLDKSNISIKKKNNFYYIDGNINPIGENIIKMNMHVHQDNQEVNGKIFLNIKDMAPLTTPFDFPTVGRIKGNVLFNHFSLLNKKGKIDLDLHSKFFKSPLFKAALTTVKGCFLGDLSTDIIVNSKDFSSGKNLIADKTALTIKGDNGVYDISATSKSSKKGYLSSNLDLNFDSKIDINKQAITLNSLSIFHLKQRLKLLSPSVIYLNPLQIKDLNLNIGNGTLSCKEIKKNTNNTPWGGSVLLKNIPIGILNWFIPRIIMTGNLNGSLELKGSSTDFPDFSLNLKGNDLHWRQLHLDDTYKKNVLTFDFSCENINKIIAWSFFVNGDNLAHWNFKGRIPLNKESNEPMSGSIKGFINLSLISAIIATGDRLGGPIYCDLILSGTHANPLWKGTITADNAYVELAEFGTVINNIKAKILANDKKWIIKSITATDQPLESKNKKGGTLLLKGDFDFSNFFEPYISLDLKLKDYLVVDMDSITGNADAHLKVEGEGIYAKISGNIDVHKLKIDLDILQTEDGIPAIEIKDPKKRKYAKDYQEDHFLDKNKKQILPLDLKIYTHNNFLMSGLVIRDSLWGGTLVARGPIADVYLDGSISIIKGALVLFGKVLNIDRGNLTFIAHEENEPWFTMQASRKINTITVMVNIDNKKNPLVQFDSSPSMDQNEVLSWLLFGQGVGNISAGQTIELATALTKSKSGNSFDFIEDVRKIIGLDSFELRNYQDKKSSNLEQATEQAIHLGKKLSENVEISLEQGTGQSSSKVGIEMDVGNNIILSADYAKKNEGVSSGPTTGAGITWGKRY